MVLSPGGRALVAAKTGDHGPASAGDVAHRDAPLPFGPAKRFELCVGDKQLAVGTEVMMLSGKVRQGRDAGFPAGPRILQDVRNVENSG